VGFKRPKSAKVIANNLCSKTAMYWHACSVHMHISICSTDATGREKSQTVWKTIFVDKGMQHNSCALCTFSDMSDYGWLLKTQFCVCDVKEKS
jgi:hypothetical protein